jgi:hypothetical protein
MPRLRAAVAPVMIGFLAAGAMSGFPAAQASGQIGPASPAHYDAPAGYRPKEFTIVRKDGWFHVFYIRENMIPGAPTQRSFGHAISRDLYTWTEQDTILPVVPGTFEETQMWAPSLHKVDGVYYLFYPGMRNDPAHGFYAVQTLTYAVSTDLYQWTRRSTPLFNNSIFPWSYQNDRSYQGRDCRDPFLWRDEARGEWLLYLSTRPAANPQSMQIGIVGSTDLETWYDRGPIPVTEAGMSFSNIAESAHIFTRNGNPLFLLWTTDANQSLTYAKSSDPVTGWGNRDRLSNMLGYSTLGWWATEIFADGARTYFANVLDYSVHFWDLIWDSDSQFHVSVPEAYQILKSEFDRPSALPGELCTLSVVTVHNQIPRVVELDYTRLENGTETPFDAWTIGLPDTVVVVGDSIAVPWIAARPPDERPFHLIVRPRAVAGAGDTIQIAGTTPPFVEVKPEPDPYPFIRVRLVASGQGTSFVRDRAPLGWMVRIHDARGRQVWRGAAPAGQLALTWPGSDDGGRRLPGGIYFARIENSERGIGAGTEAVRMKVVLLPRSR